jgi:F-type H+-transporting ATPase subunit delta
MTSQQKRLQQRARQFFKLSFADGVLSAERVAGVLAYIEAHEPVHALPVTRMYRRLVAAETARGEAVVEHAGALPSGTLPSITTVMTTRYRRPVAARARRNDALIAGLRVRVADDVYESSVAQRLDAISSAL